MELADRSDLLAWLGRYARGKPPAVRRAERWRRRGWSGRRIAAAAERIAASLAERGVAEGDRVALLLNDGPLWHAGFLGVLRAGAVAVPLDVSLEAGILRERAAELDLAAVITEREAPAVDLQPPRIDLDWRSGAPAAAVEPPALPDDDPERTAEIVLTSGTSGAPKAVPVRHRNLLAVLDALDRGVGEYRWALRFAPTMRIAVSLPLSHLYGQVMGVFVPSILGARVSLLPTMPAPDLARVLREEGAWALATVPRTLDLLGRHLRALGEERWGEEAFERRLAEALEGPWWRRPATFAPLRRAVGRRLLAVVSGGAALDRDVEDLWRAMGYVVVQGYGLTETAPLVTLVHPFDPAPGSLGRALPGVEVRIADDGEILVRGPNVVPARLGGAAVDEKGWLHTGDLGRHDEAGRLHYLGRKGERIVTPAGVNVDPEPVVEALRFREGVRDAVVLERPWGERGVVTAVLLTAPGGDPAAAVRAANEKLPDASRVRDWHVWPEADFPRTHTGKPRRPALREWLEARAPEEAREEAEPEEARESSEAPADAYAVLSRAAADVAGVDEARLERSDRIGDVLGSLDRVELVTRLETVYGVALGEAAFDADRTLGELADDLHAAVSGAAESAERAEPREAAEAGRSETETEGREEAEAPAGAPAPPAEGPAQAPSPPAAWLPSPARGRGRAARIPRARWRHRVPVRAARFALREGVVRPLWRSFIDLDAAGAERIGDLEPPFLVATNHQSHFDTGAVVYGLPYRYRSRIAPAALWEFIEAARTGPFLYRLGVVGFNLIPLVQRGDWRPTLEIAGAVADRGGCPLLFPEGERTLDGELLPFHRGAAIMARDLHLPIVPCALTGLLEVLPRGARWPRNFWTRRAPVAVRFGEPLPDPRPDEAPDAIIDELRRRIEVLYAEAREAAGEAG